MTKELLIENLQVAIASCGLEFHIVFNDDSIKFARLKDDIAEKLKNQFLYELNSLFLEDTGYSLRPIQEADENLGIKNKRRRHEYNKIIGSFK